ncbi:MarR family winged helix-turn-helix transcriptional regulator [Nakamurella sp.]|uniref:MarR family winged helix-turn-helix transcriptional regulator n=1 Tax=Nakamurella sp. TaxID=1869182 RepID=UPI003B3B209F
MATGPRGDRDPGPPADRYRALELDNQICFALYSASRAIVRAYTPLLADLGLTYPQYLVMLVLWERPADAVGVCELGQHLLLDSGTLTPLLKRLEGLGHVTRRRHDTDERRVVIALTPSGLALRERAAAIPGEIGQRTGLSVGRLVELRDELTRLVGALESDPGPAGR